MLPDLLTAIPASCNQLPPAVTPISHYRAKCLIIVYGYSIPHSPPRHTVHISSPFTFCITPLLVVCKLVSINFIVTMVLFLFPPLL
ncbi:hypothetical protein GDO78_015238 [Eleutherodactylus coqui]|uniref:Uncharacterized protein n=1 Tax=Eleutherodactylus coqui TaxID=57060 RepID=A0A8J6E6P3_ELECQ|nr:hypothetical protein GDO78_015238 [Eleutherodactylus coqui]